MMNVYDGSSPDTERIAKYSPLLPKPLFIVAKWFSLSSSLRDLFTVKSRNVADVDTRFFEGVRVLAMLFVIYGHTLYFEVAGTGLVNTVQTE